MNVLAVNQQAATLWAKQAGELINGVPGVRLKKTPF